MIKITITIEEVPERSSMAITHNFNSDENTTLAETLIANGILAASERLTIDMRGNMKDVPEGSKD